MAKHFKEYCGLSRLATKENTRILSYDPATKSLELITISEGQRATINAPSWSLDIPALFFDGVSIVQIANKNNIVIESTEEEH